MGIDFLPWGLFLALGWSCGQWYHICQFGCSGPWHCAILAGGSGNLSEDVPGFYEVSVPVLDVVAGRLGVV